MSLEFVSGFGAFTYLDICLSGSQHSYILDIYQEIELLVYRDHCLALVDAAGHFSE